MSFVSVIVPIFNQEKYLSTCIESLLNQTLSDIEIILINDGSTDRSLKICERYREFDKRIKVVNQDNNGVSYSRNLGIKLAKSSYIYFIDPDDWVEANMLLNLYNNISKNKTDMCFSDYIVDTKYRSKIKKLSIDEDVLNEDNIYKKLIYNMIAKRNFDFSNTIMGSVWRIMINKKFLDLNNINFREDLSIMEDLVFVLEALKKTQSVSIERSAYYHYVKHDVSIMSRYKENYLTEAKKVFYYIDSIFLKNIKDNHYLDIRYLLRLRYLNIFLNYVKQEAHSENHKKLNIKIRQIKENFDDKYLIETIKKIKFSSIKNSKKIQLFLLKHRMLFALYLLSKITQRIIFHKERMG